MEITQKDDLYLDYTRGCPFQCLEATTVIHKANFQHPWYLQPYLQPCPDPLGLLHHRHQSGQTSIQLSKQFNRHCTAILTDFGTSVQPLLSMFRYS